MRPWEQSHLTRNRANVVKPSTIKAFVEVHDQVTNCLFLNIIKGILQDELRNSLLSKTFHQLFSDFFRQRSYRGLAREFLLRQQSRNNAITSQTLRFVQNLRRHHIQRNLALWLS